MIEFEKIPDDHPALSHSPMVRGLARTFDYIAEHGGIGLTPSKAFKRKFVEWAAGEFDWPGHTEADLFAINKVLNEWDFPPLEMLHGLMILMELGRHYKGQFRLTRAGQALVGHPGRLFGIVTPIYLFEVDHTRYGRRAGRLIGNWDIFLNVLNVKAEDGATAADLRNILYGEPDPGDGFDEILSSLYLEVLRPLCWTGVLREDRVHGFRTDDRVFTKTPLWRAAFELSTDGAVRPATRH
jgi:hypothetical protein